MTRAVTATINTKSANFLYLGLHNELVGNEKTIRSGNNLTQNILYVNLFYKRFLNALFRDFNNILFEKRLFLNVSIRFVFSKRTSCILSGIHKIKYFFLLIAG